LNELRADGLESELENRLSLITPLGPETNSRAASVRSLADDEEVAGASVHAVRQTVRKEFHEAYAWFVTAFREAAEKLRAGDRTARFPEGSFPPPLPFARARLPAFRPSG